MALLVPLLGSLVVLMATWCTTGSRGRRRIGVVIALTAMLSPWFFPAPPLFRAMHALVMFVNVMRVVDLVRVDWPFGRRVLHVISVIDSRRVVRRAPRFEARGTLALLVWMTLVPLSVAAIAHAPSAGIAHWIVRWMAGVVAVYSAVAGLYRFLFVFYSALGFDTPPLHVMPARARSVQELWGERWARPISDWLAATFFRPWARRRRPLVGVLLAFAVSAAFHAYAIWVGLGFFAGMTMMSWTFAYFVAQAIIMSIEQPLGVRRWSKPAGHAWTIAWMLVLAPMFVEPVLHLL